jgi:hypothetical protein
MKQRRYATDRELRRQRAAVDQVVGLPARGVDRSGKPVGPERVPDVANGEPPEGWTVSMLPILRAKDGSRALGITPEVEAMHGRRVLVNGESVTIDTKDPEDIPEDTVTEGLREQSP